MATIYSLVCWAGSGVAVTFTDAGDLVNWTAHGVRQYEYGTTKMIKRVRFTTSGSLPTGLAIDTDYYAVRSTDNALLLYSTNADAIAGTNQKTFSGTGSGTHMMIGGYYLSLTAEQKARYGSGNERIYKGLVAWNTARVAAGVGILDTEICELGEAFNDVHTAQFNCNMPCLSQQITSYVNGSRSTAFHDGVTGKGFIVYINYSYQAFFVMKGYLRRVIEGFTMLHHGQSSVAISIQATANASTVKNMLLYSDVSYTNTGAISFYGIAVQIYNNIIHSFKGNGINRSGYGRELSYLYNNIVCKCGVGFVGGTQECYISAINNIAVGNTTNWSTEPNAIELGLYNAGETGDTPWSTGTDTSVIMATTDFMDYTNNDYRPASPTSPQVCTGMDLSVYGLDGHDIVNRIRPSWYQSEDTWLLHTAWSIGAYEHNFGDPPVMADITIQNIQDGSRWLLYNVTDDTALESGTQSGTLDIVVSNVVYNGSSKTLKLVVRKSSASPFYKPFETNAIFTGNNLSIYVSQELDTVAGS